ncbi:hypothetical protein D917_10417, partial [Trichinella nativa]
VQDVAKLRRKAVTTKLSYSIYRRNSNRSGLQGTLPTRNFNAHASATLIRESDERGWAEQYRWPQKALEICAMLISLWSQQNRVKVSHGVL